MQRIHTAFFILALTVTLAGCGDEPPTVTKQLKNREAPRVQDAIQIARGEKLYQTNCASCHGVNGQGAFNWKKVGADGKYRAPPLNGSGHAWHHPTKALRHVIKNGSPGGNGNMPGWKDQMSDQQIDDVIAWFQSKWSDKIYQAWIQRTRSTGFTKKSGN